MKFMFLLIVLVFLFVLVQMFLFSCIDEVFVYFGGVQVMCLVMVVVGVCELVLICLLVCFDFDLLQVGVFDGVNFGFVQFEMLLCECVFDCVYSLVDEGLCKFEVQCDQLIVELSVLDISLGYLKVLGFGEVCVMLVVGIVVMVEGICKMVQEVLL